MSAAARVRARFEPSGREVELASGERLLDAVDDQLEPGLLPIACRAGNCGACLVSVLAGARWLEPPSTDERAALSQLGRGRDARLGCQLSARTVLLALDPAPSDPRLVILRINGS